MCEIMRRAEEQAILESSLETAKSLISLHKLSLEEIAASTKLSLEEVRKLAKAT